MLERLAEIERRYEELDRLVAEHYEAKK